MTARGLRQLEWVTRGCPPPGDGGTSAAAGSGHVLVVDDGSALARALVPVLRHGGYRPLVLQVPGDGGAAGDGSLAAPVVRAGGQEPAAVERALDRLRRIGGALRGIVFVHAAPPAPGGAAGVQLDRLYLAIAVARGAGLSDAPAPAFLYFVTAQGGGFGLDPEPSADAIAPALEALCHPLALELPQTSVRSIDLDRSADPHREAARLLTELATPDRRPRTAFGWRNGERVTPGFREVPAPAAGASGDGDAPHRGAVVVFAGGARGIGAACARELARRGPCHLVFLGRSVLDAESAALAAASPEARAAQEAAFRRDFRARQPQAAPRAARAAWGERVNGAAAQATLLAVRALGAGAEYHAVDVRDRFATGAVLRDVRRRLGRIDAVVHVAGLGGVETDRVLARCDGETVRRVVETKARGAVNLLAAAGETGVPLFVGFGSVAARFGNRGQVAYSAANGLLTGIVRAHNAAGALPRARVIHWGAWDGAGMAVSGATRELLAAGGVELIPPAAGAARFAQLLLEALDPSRASRPAADVAITAGWPGLDALLEPVAPPPAAVAPAGDALGVDFRLDPADEPLLDHHRYLGTVWVPAVLGMELAARAAGRLLPGRVVFGLREVVLKKAVRLIRDRPAVLRVDVRAAAPEAAAAAGADHLVRATLTARSGDDGPAPRSWTFAEMDVLLAGDAQRAATWLDGAYPADAADGADVVAAGAACYRRGDLYPSDWLRFQQHGTTFQVLDEVRVDARARRAAVRLAAAAGTPRGATPATLIDGLLQAYGATTSILDGRWSGPPLRIGDVRWRPQPDGWEGSLRCVVRFDARDPQRFPVWDARDGAGRRQIAMRGLVHGGTSVREVGEGRAQPAPPPVPAVIAPAAVRDATPYLGRVLEHVAGERLRAARVLDPQGDPLLRDHRFDRYVLVPAVYYLEVAAEAAALLLPGTAPAELRDFRFSRALTLVRERRTLLTQADVLDVSPEAGAGPARERRCRVRFFSRGGGGLTLHAEGVVALAPLPLRRATAPLPPLAWDERRPLRVARREDLYPRRFPNGPVFQVVERMELGEDHTARAALRRVQPLAPDTLLPLTLLDGAFQVDSATRSGFDRPSGLPHAFDSLRWRAGAAALEAVTCLSHVGDSGTGVPGRIDFLAGDAGVVLQLSGITLTAPFSALWSGVPA